MRNHATTRFVFYEQPGFSIFATNCTARGFTLVVTEIRSRRDVVPTMTLSMLSQLISFVCRASDALLKIGGGGGK